MSRCRTLAAELSRAIYEFKSGSRGQPIFAVARYRGDRLDYTNEPRGIPVALWRA